MITKENNRKFMLLFYLNKYKEYPVSSRDSFRNYFIHNHGLYSDLDLLIQYIEKYQMNVYNQTLQGNMDHRKEKRHGGR